MIGESDMYFLHFVVNFIAVIGIWLALIIVRKFPRSHRLPLTLLAVGKIIEVLGESTSQASFILVGRTVEDGALCLLSMLLINYWRKRSKHEDTTD